MKNKHTGTWHDIMLIFSDIITISFSLYLKGNVTYKYITNVHTLQRRTTLSKFYIILFYYKIVHVVQNNEINTRDNQK